MFSIVSHSLPALVKVIKLLADLNLWCSHGVGTQSIDLVVKLMNMPSEYPEQKTMLTAHHRLCVKSICHHVFSIICSGC